MAYEDDIILFFMLQFKIFMNQFYNSYFDTNNNRILNTKVHLFATVIYN